MRVAVEHVRRMRGGSQPHLLRCDDGSFYIVKFINNPQGVRVLASDMFATRLAGRMGICVPDVDVVNVNATLIKNTYDLAMELTLGRVRCEPGKQFGSKYPGHPATTQTYNFVSQHQIPNITNLEDFLGIFVFDLWTCNADSRQAILYEQPGPISSYTSRKLFRVMMIDQGLCFNSGKWEFPDRPSDRIYVKRELYESVHGIEAFEPWLNWLENQLTFNLLREEAERVPSEWYEGDCESWMRLVRCLYARRTCVRELIRRAQNNTPNPFPNWTLRVHIDPDQVASRRQPDLLSK